MANSCAKAFGQTATGEMIIGCSNELLMMMMMIMIMMMKMMM